MAKTVHPPYNLKVPVDAEVAEVPKDMEELADTIATALDLKLDKTVAASDYQLKIEVIVGTTLPASRPEGTVVFLIAP